MPDPKRRRCPICEKRFTPSRSDAVTCSSACRQKAYRRRQNPPTRTAPRRPPKPAQIKKTSSGKGPRGGAGRNQGRKRVLAYLDMILVGADCEGIWDWLKERNALAKHRNQTHIKDINDIRKTGASIEEISEDIDKILDTAHRTRPSHLLLKRPKGKRELVKRIVIRRYQRTHGIVLSPRRVQACWEEYRRFKAALPVPSE